MIEVSWTGAAGLRFEAGETSILVDPYYTRVGLAHALLTPIAPDETAIVSAIPFLDKINAVIVGHTHSDHALDVPFIVSRSNAKLVGSSSLDTLMAASGLPGRTITCRGGETIPLTESASVTMIRSTHGLVALGKVPFQGEIRSSITLPMKASGYRVGTAFAPKLELNDMVFIHNGSANFIESEMEGHTCDVLFLCVAGWKKREGYPERVMDMTGPRSVVLFHYDDFSKHHKPGAKTRELPMMDMQGLIRRIKAHAPRVQVIVPEVGEVMAFD